MFAREFRNCLKDPRRLIFIFGASIVYLFLFGMLYQPNIVQKIPTVIFDEDQSKLSREIIQNFSDSDAFEIVDYARRINIRKDIFLLDSIDVVIRDYHFCDRKFRGG
ncbi:MAG: hypothetical protein IJ575_03235 [Selenomonadaceae bacterium]|nr:hypothetical protein [Selenomonadaceae bacterium]